MEGSELIHLVSVGNGVWFESTNSGFLLSISVKKLLEVDVEKPNVH